MGRVGVAVITPGEFITCGACWCSGYNSGRVYYLWGVLV